MLGSVRDSVLGSVLYGSSSVRICSKRELGSVCGSFRYLVELGLTDT